jgi:hypothetical protein
VGGRATTRSAASTSLSPDSERRRVRSDARDSFCGADAGPAAARVPRCVIAALFLLALGVVVATFVLPAIVRILRIRGGAGGDRARLVLVFAVRRASADRTEWAVAMLVELDQIQGWTERWAFSLGCLWALVRMRAQSREPGGALLRVVVLGCSGVALALVAYGLVQYPGLRSEGNFWGAICVFLATLLMYVALTVLLSRGTTRQSTASRRYGVVGGAAVGVGWLVGLAPPSDLKGWVFFPLLVALLGPALVAIVAAQRADDSGTGILAALWSGLVGGLGVFIVWMVVTYSSNGGPYDAGLVADFQKSGAPDLATYAVSDNLGSGLVLLVTIPTVALALGSLGARIRGPGRPAHRDRIPRTSGGDAHPVVLHESGATAAGRPAVE